MNRINFCDVAINICYIHHFYRGVSRNSGGLSGHLRACRTTEGLAGNIGTTSKSRRFISVSRKMCRTQNHLSQQTPSLAWIRRISFLGESPDLYKSMNLSFYIDPSYHGVILLCNYLTMEPSHHRTNLLWNYITMEISYHEATLPWSSLTMKPSNHGSIFPWSDLTTELYYHGTILP